MLIYLDYASHTPPLPEVLEEFTKIARECAGNPNSVHRAGQMAYNTLTRAKKGIADLLDVKPEEIIFTSGASEANNLAIKGITQAYGHKGRHILSTCLEHPSVSGTLAFLKESGFDIELLKINTDGQIDLSHFKKAVRADTILVCVSAADSELGAVQPLEDIAEILSAHPSAHLHIDAAQAIGKIPVYTKGGSTLCFSPHKFHGLCGFGVLVKREGVVLSPLIHGGGKEDIYRGGTQSPAMASACFLALETALRNMEGNIETVSAINRYLREKIEAFPQTRINSPESASPYILNVSVNGIKGRDFVSALDNRGIAVSVKSACGTDNTPSRPVYAVSGDKKNAMNSWRISLSHQVKTHETDAFLKAFEEIILQGHHPQ